MNNFSKLSTIVLAGVTAAMLSSTATFAQTGYKETYQSVKDSLESMQVPTKDLGMLTVEKLGELTAILDGTGSSSEKQAAAEKLLNDAKHPETMTLNNAGAKQLEAELKADLEGVGLKYPGNDKLSLGQVQRLLEIFQTPDSTDGADASAVLNADEHPTVEKMGNAGAIQLEKELKGNLDSIGIVLPANEKLTFQQVIDLTAIFDKTGSGDDVATAAKAVLGIK